MISHNNHISLVSQITIFQVEQKTIKQKINALDFFLGFLSIRTVIMTFDVNDWVVNKRNVQNLFNTVFDNRSKSLILQHCERSEHQLILNFRAKNQHQIPQEDFVHF